MRKNTEKKQSRIVSALLDISIIINLCVHMVLFDYSWIGFQRKYGLFAVTSRVLMVFFFITLFAAMKIYGAYSFRLKRRSELITSHTIALCLTYALGYLVQILIMHRFGKLAPFFLRLFQSIVFSALWVIVVDWFYHRYVPPMKTLILYEKEEAADVVSAFVPAAREFEVTQRIDISDIQDRDVLNEKIAKSDTVFFCGIRHHIRDEILETCMQCDTCAYICPDLRDINVRCAQHIELFHQPVLMVDFGAKTLLYNVTKRAFDIVAAVLGLTLTSPVFLIAALCIKLQDGGSVFYTQERLTQGGKSFKIYKFRSMRENAEKDGVARLAEENDSRITPIGKFMRATRIDELPQLFNILKGDMSLVGPRPERPEIAQQYEKTLPEFKLRLKVKAGLTGYAQVYGQYNTDPYNKLAMDLIYIANASISQDLAILLKTVQVVFTKESTQGVDEGQTNALRK